MLDHYQAEFLKASSGVVKSYVVPGGQVCRCGKMSASLSVTSRSLRCSDQGLLVDPGSRLQTKGERVFEVVGPKLWNSLQVNFISVDTFKKQLKTNLFRLAFISFVYCLFSALRFI